jgi:hypothetical protein
MAPSSASAGVVAALMPEVAPNQADWVLHRHDRTSRCDAERSLTEGILRTINWRGR